MMVGNEDHAQKTFGFVWGIVSSNPEVL